jgi:hypothetical protein
MIRRIFFSLVLVSLMLIPSVSFAYDSGICKGTSLCTQTEVGPLMQNITKECGNSGTCSLADIMTVFVNVANYILGIIAVVVLLMYVIGGMYMIASGGVQERVTKGKKYLTVSTMGLLIVMFAFLGIHSLEGALRFGTFTQVEVVEGGYVAACTEDTESLPCGFNKVCLNDLCVSECVSQFGATGPEIYSETDEVTIYVGYTCTDVDVVPSETSSTGSLDAGYNWFESSTCKKNFCPGGDNIQCCEEWLIQEK